MKFAVWILCVLFAGSLILFIQYDRTLGRDIFSYSIPPFVAVTIFALWRTGLFRKPDGSPVTAFQAPNILTSIRLLLVAPVIVLFSHGLAGPATIMYILILLSDVADGAIARRFRQETAFGLMLDPFADVASTVAVFSWLLIKGLVPQWLFIILMVRYAEFFVGLLILTLIGRPPRLRATKPGKMAGCIQGVGVLVILLQNVLSYNIPVKNIESFTFTILAAALVIVIISQTRIGLEAIRNNTGAERGGI
ncbi:MAG: CDP-alcohol phosphatidyltransferase family protein [Candidatus Krumholzibacteriota bacterium]|nr:CDP-alcohol phosphatidyltransferase family protein [Candidatus Krumholzibacteriota bacterium]